LERPHGKKATTWGDKAGVESDAFEAEEAACAAWEVAVGLGVGAGVGFGGGGGEASEG